MKRSIFTIAFAALCLSVTARAGSWTLIPNSDAPRNLRVMDPKNYLVYKFDDPALKTTLFALSTDPALGIVVSLPLPDGTFRDFKVWQAPMMPDDLATQFPDIKTFTAEAVNDRSVTAKLDFTLYGFHAMIFDGERTSFVDPYDNYSDGYYMVHYKKEETRVYSATMKCQVHGAHADQDPGGVSTTIQPKSAGKSAAKTMNGYTARTYRLALSADHFYCQAATGLGTPTIAQALSKMTTTMNRVNGIYERELSVHMNFVSAENSIIWPTATDITNGADPFNAIDANANSCTNKNQTVCDSRITSANYDIGHVFTTGAGGLSSLGVVCKFGQKAQSVTGSSSPTGDGFDVDYVAHEMGHEFGGEHPFNNGTDGSCGGDNRNQPTSYEPGSGSTIMAYAGICDPDDVQFHSDAYFHGANLSQMQLYISGSGNTCAAKTATGNTFVKYSSFTAAYSIPYLTPFELTGPALTDSVSDSATLYCWEQFDLGVNDVNNEGTTFPDTHDVGPLFRSYSPTTSDTRVFPKMSMVLAGSLSNAGVEGNEGEKVPDVARTLTFKCTFRDIYHNYGCITIPDDQITLTAVNTGAGFKVTSQGVTGISYAGGSTQTITWNVANSDAAPISAATVDIFMSTDGGSTWGAKIGTYPNTGSANITVPNPSVTTASARFKVKGTGNVFFNVNLKNFTVTNNGSVGSSVGRVIMAANDAMVYPVPASGVLHVVSSGVQRVVVYDVMGRQVWSGSMSGSLDIPVSDWVKGVYGIRLTDSNEQVVIKKIVVE